LHLLLECWAESILSFTELQTTLMPVVQTFNLFFITFWQLFDKFFMASMSIDRWKWKNCEKQSCQVSRWHLQLFLSVFGSDWSIEIKPLNSCQRPIKNFLHVGLVWRTALWPTCSFDQTWIEPTQVKITDQGPTRHYSQGRVII